MRNPASKQYSSPSRRQFLRTAAVAGAGIAVSPLISCAREAPAPTPGRLSEPRRGGVFTRRTSDGGPFRGGLDPHVLSSANTGLMGLFYQTLVRLNPRTFEVEPELAQTWESPSPTDLILRLRPGVTWHKKPPIDGRNLTAEDVVINLNRMNTTDPRFGFSTLIEAIERVEAVDSRTVKVTLRQADVTTLGSLASSSRAILAPEVLDRYAGKMTTANTAAGTGAFVLESLDDVSVTLARNVDYWKPGLPHLDGLRLNFLPNEQVGWAAFLAGQLDVCFVPGGEAKQVLSEQEGKPYSGDWFSDTAMSQTQVNSRTKPFDDIRVGRALRLLVDHEEAITGWAEVWYGRGCLASYLPAALCEWDFTEEEYKAQFLEWRPAKHDAVREALALLNASGFNRDSPLKFTMSGNGDTQYAKARGELLQSQLRRLGQGVVDPMLKLHDNPTLTNLRVNGDFDYLIMPVAAPAGFEPDSWLQTLHHSRGGRNYGKYSDSVVDHMIEQQRMLLDHQQRKAAVKEVLRYLIESSPNTGWAGTYQANAAKRHVRNFAPEGLGAIWGHQYEQVWLET